MSTETNPKSFIYFNREAKTIKFLDARIIIFTPVCLVLYIFSVTKDNTFYSNNILYKKMLDLLVPYSVGYQWSYPESVEFCYYQIQARKEKRHDITTSPVFVMVCMWLLRGKKYVYKRPR